MNTGKGFTLIELLVTLSILAGLCAIGTPILESFLVQTRVDNEIYTLQRLLLITRNAAINQEMPVTFCALDNDNHCSLQWHQQLSVFTDGNNNQTLETSLGEKIISVKAPINADDKLQYGTIRTAITYDPSGHLASWGQNATFCYCPKSHQELSKGLTVATSGRLYLSSNNNSQEVEKNRSGKKISCY